MVVRVIPFDALGATSVANAIAKLLAGNLQPPPVTVPVTDNGRGRTNPEARSAEFRHGEDDRPERLQSVLDDAKDDMNANAYRRFEANTKIMDITYEVFEEVKRAKEKHPVGAHSPHEGHSIIREELEELWAHVKNDTGRSPEARKEAIQTAAMAVRYILDLID